MTDEEIEDLLERSEAQLERDVREALSQVAYEFTRSVRASTSLTAASFSVSSIRGMWQRHVPALMRRLMGIVQRGARETARGLDAGLPPEYDDLPGRVDPRDRRELPPELEQYETDTRRLLMQVGDTLAQEAVRELAEGMNAGESQAQLEARMIRAFNRTSPDLGPDRANRIARTESTRAWNAGTLAAAEVITGPDRPLVKQWITRMDERVRASHREANGQLRLLAEEFDVGGYAMMYPGDPTAPAAETINCRCILRTEPAPRDSTLEGGPSVTASDDVKALQSRMPAQLKRYWLTGPGALKIRWGTPGSFDRCVRELKDDFPQDPEGLCANLYHEATGQWPGRRGNAAETAPEGTYDVDEDVMPDGPVPWVTDDDEALAFENQQTGDGRVFAPGALYWEDGPWPLQYADEMNGGHDGAELAGAIQYMTRDGDRLAATGVLYPNLHAGSEAIMLLAEGAPLGVSVDLDDVDVEMVSMIDDGGGGMEPADEEPYRARLVTASVLPLDDGGFLMTGETAADWTASGESLAGESRRITFHVGADGRIPGDAVEVTAAAGDPGTGGTVMDSQKCGDYLMRITRARVRGATLVTIPAYSRARIQLASDVGYALAASAGASEDSDYADVVAYVRSSGTPVSASAAAHSLKLPMSAVKRYLAAASQKGQIVRIARGTYIRSNQVQTASAADWTDELSAAATGAVDLPVADRDTEWDGDAAAHDVFEWAQGDTSKIAQAFAYRDDQADPATLGAYKLGYARPVDGRLTIIPKGVFAAEGALNGARGGVDIPASQMDAVRNKLTAVRAHVDEVAGGEGQQQMEASAWSAMKDLPAMPAAWFREPTAEELPPGGAGVNYAAGRIFGWVAQAGEPHAGFAKKITIDGLGRIGTEHFLRQRFTLDDGSTVKAGAFTMNAGHHRDGAECETAACQFDDTRFVAGIITVGMNERGMWFSGAAAPWLSEWDRSVFMSCQPSYHMRKGSNGQWQLRAVLSVPVPGHSSPLMASAVAERAQVALTAAATMAEVEEAVAAADAAQAAVQDTAPAAAAGIDYDRLADALVAAMGRADQRKAEEAAELEALLAEARSLSASGYDGTATETGTEED